MVLPREIDKDKLFETRSVEEVERVLNSINLEIESKKEELRTLVGERYRDLIEAADKIKEMKEISNRVIQDVDDIGCALGKLQKKQLSYEDRSVVDKKPMVSDEIAAQFGVLVDLPEVIWDSVGDKNYLKASQLFLFGRHVKTCLDVDRKFRESVQGMGVLNGVWKNLAHFPGTIVDAAEGDLKSLDVNPQTAATCLASVHLLQNIPVMNKFLELRMSSLSEVLSTDENVLESILRSCQCIIRTLSLLKICFLDRIESGQGLVWHKLNLACRNQTPISLLERTIGVRFLPAVISMFKLGSVDNVIATNVEAAVGDWLEAVKSLVSTKGKALLTQVDNLHDLNALKNDYSTSDVEWESLMETFKVDSRFKLWDDLFKPLVSQRTKELISQLCEATQNEVMNHVNSALMSDSDRQDLDLRWFVWKETEDDFDQQNAAVKGLLLKSKAIVPKIANICQHFDETLGKFYKDLAGFYNTDNLLSVDVVELKNYQQNMVLGVVLKLKEFIRDSVAKEGIYESKLVVLARFLQAVPDLCPMLQKCLTLGDTKGNSWHEVKLLLNSESMFCWGLWEEKTLKRIQSTYLNSEKRNESYADLLTTVPQWDVTWIEEDSECKSQLKVPSAPSFRLQSILIKITSDLSRAHLPRLILENITQKILTILIHTYDTSSLCTSESFQTLFDLKYLTSLYVPLTNKTLLSSCAEKIAIVESSIDPIDFEVFSPIISKKVKESIHKTQGIFGNSFSGEDSVSLQIGDDPCILSLSKSASSVWFPSLPLTNPSSKPLHLIKTKASKLGKPINEIETSKSAVVTASSFFADWFS